MKGFFKYVFAGLLGTLLAMIVVTVIAVVIIVAAVSSGEEDVELKEKTVLTVSLADPISDQSFAKPNFASFGIDKTEGLHALLQAIKEAETDPRIKGIYLDLTTVDAGMATVKEMRDALVEFKKTKKFIIAHADFYTHKSYYLATAADKIYLTPEGEVQFLGLSTQIIMFKSLLEKVGVEPEIIRHGKFKSAVEPFMLTEISESNRLQTSKYIGSLWQTMLTAVSETRGISVADLNKYADSITISSAKRAKDYKFVDDLKYFDEVQDELKTLTETGKDDDLETITLAEYINTEKEGQPEEKFTKDRIAVIYATGEIGMGEGDEESIGSESLAKAIREAREDKDVKAIVLRINSPGGSALASEVIWRETVLAKKAKPLIVSMGDVAASGGYYIACQADTIVAQPNTITGSIGVFGLMFGATKLMTTVGINVSNVNTNTHSDLGNPSRKMQDYERKVIQTGVEEIYGTFITHVAEGRGMTTAQIDSIGQGRVWAGTDALNIGLVDVLGGLNDAIAIAKEKAKLKEYRIKEYPEKDEVSKIIETMMSDTKTDVIKSELGDSYKYYQYLKNVQNMEGVQARIPYFLEIQ